MGVCVVETGQHAKFERPVSQVADSLIALGNACPCAVVSELVALAFRNALVSSWVHEQVWIGWADQYASLSWIVHDVWCYASMCAHSIKWMRVCCRGTFLYALVAVAEQRWPRWAQCWNARHCGWIGQSCSWASFNTFWCCWICRVKILWNWVSRAIWYALSCRVIFVKVVRTVGLTGPCGLNSKAGIVADGHTRLSSVIFVQRGIDWTACHTSLSRWVFVQVISNHKRTSESAVVVASVTKGILTRWAFCCALSRKVVCVNVRTGTQIFSHTNSVQWITVLCSLGACSAADFSVSISVVARDVAKESRRALGDASSGCCISEFTTRTFRNTFTGFVGTVFSKERSRTSGKTLAGIVSKSSCWTVSDTHFCNIIDKVSGQTSLHTCSVACDALNEESFWADVNTHFDVGVCVWEEFSGSISGTIGCAGAGEWITVLIGRTLGGLDTVIVRVKKSVVGTFGNASVFNVGQGLIDKVIPWAIGGACSVGIKSKLSKGTELEALFRNRLSKRGRVGGTDWIRKKITKSASAIVVIVVGLICRYYSIPGTGCKMRE